VRSNSVRKVSQATTRKVSVTSPTACRTSTRQASNTARRVSGQPKQPLGLDMSFGNSASTVRMFKRVSSSDGSENNKLPSGYLSPQDSVFDTDAENRPPQQQQKSHLQSPPVVAATKESVLGRRMYAKCIEPALQEAQATTADRSKREALSRAAEAWSRLDELDPEGELLLMKGLLERISNDPKLAAALLPRSQQQQQQSPSKKASIASSTTSTLVNADSSDMMLLSPSSHNNSAKYSLARRHSEAPPPISPSKNQHSRPFTPVTSSSPTKPHHSRDPSSPSKLVMNPQNPHLAKHRHSMQLVAPSPEREKGLPGGMQEPGMEHVGYVAEALYGRWAEGLRGRWGMMG
jgi:serine/threonine-protein kinase 24/25/MST4